METESNKTRDLPNEPVNQLEIDIARRKYIVFPPSDPAEDNICIGCE